MKNPDQDDLDRLFALSEAPAPPVDIGGRARARLRAIRGARRLTLIALLDSGALLVLGVLAFLLGSALAHSGLLLLVRLAVEDRALALEAWQEITLTLVDGLPWPYVLATALDVLLLVGLTSRLLRDADTLLRAWPAGGRQ